MVRARALAPALVVACLAGCGPTHKGKPREPARPPSLALFTASGIRLVEPTGAEPLDAHPPLSAGVVADEMRVYLINVGQGASTLLEFACGAVLVDSGGEGNAEYDSVDSLYTFLEAFFAQRTDLERTLDLVVFTHPHTDHVRGGDMLLENYTVKNVVTDGMKTGSGWKAQERFEKNARDAGAKVKKVRASSVPKGGLTNEVIDPVSCDSVDPDIRVLWGQVARSAVDWSKDEFEDENNHSVVVRVTFGEASLLITGDLENEGIEELVKRHGVELDVDVYQAGHHGSKNGTDSELLTEVTPSVALIAAGSYDRELSWTAWDYGHPNVGIVELLEGMIEADHERDPIDVKLGNGKQTFVDHTLSMPIYSTAWDGTVRLTLHSDGAIDAVTEEQ